MFNAKIERKLENIKDLPVLPANLANILKALDNTNIRSSKLAELIQTDQTLTTKILSAANSPWYGSSGKIATVDLAIVIMGLNTIKEIVIGMLVKKLFSKIPNYMFNIKLFWEYSIFCGSTSRLLARKFGYKKAGEAFVAGLMHDLGMLIIIQYFSYEFRQIIQLVESKKFTYRSAEEVVIGATHNEIGAWLVKKWRFPTHLVNSVYYHHSDLNKIDDETFDEESLKLTKIVSASEWFSQQLAYKLWSHEHVYPELAYSGDKIIKELENEFLNSNSSMILLKQEITNEFQRSLEFNPNYL